VAQFGRGAIADVSAALLDQFVSCLEHDLLAGDAAPVAEQAASAQPEAAVATPASVAPAPEVVAEPDPSGVRRIDSPEAEAVDLLAVAGGTFAKYAIGAIVVIAVVVILLVLLLS
jgi:hypothetical protein